MAQVAQEATKGLQRLLLVAAAIVLFAGGALFAIIALTREPRRAASVPETIQAPPPPEGPREPPPPEVQYDAPPEPPPPGSWESIAPVARAGSLGAVGTAVGRGLNALQPALADCWSEAAARGGQVAQEDNLTEARDEAPPADGTTTVLVLQVETLADQVRIVEAPLESQGSASDGLVACAQRVLRGQTFDAPGAQPGQRYRILHGLTR